MDIDLYFNPVDFSQFKKTIWAQKKFRCGNLLEKNQGKLSFDKAEIVIFGVEEDRNSVVAGAANSPDLIREHLYNLNRIASRFKILDLGNLKIGNTVTDTYFALKDVCEIIKEKGKTAVIIGGSQDLTFGLSKGFEGESFNMVSVDPKLDFKKGIKSIDSETFLNFIFEKQKNIFSHTTLGYQNYFTDSLELDHFSQLSCDAKRLGSIRYDMTIVEPILRNADIFSFDINSVRGQDAPGQYFNSPNGFYAEEACQLARYAGHSDNLSIAGFFNLMPKNDKQGQTANLMAQIIWHFIEGFYNRVIETPDETNEDFNQFIVDIEDIDLSLIFFQSRKTGRWWMEIKDVENECNIVIPCNEEDYQMASKNEIPDKWWKNLRKLDQN